MPTTWLFQANPRRYDLREAVSRSLDDNWSMNQHRDRIRERDRIYFYQSGSQAGIYAQGRAISEVHEREPDEFGRWKIDVQYDAVVDPPLLRAELLADPLLSQFRAFHGQQLTNFVMPDAVARRLEELLANRLAPIPTDDTGARGKDELRMEGLTAEDFDILARYPRSVPWDEIAEDHQARFKAVRQKLLDYANELANRLGTDVALKPFASHPNPSGRNALYYWSCAFPASVPNKSYAFQLAVIVRADHIEIGFCSGSGTGGSYANEVKLKALGSVLDQARDRLRGLLNDGRLDEVAAWTRSAGYRLRQRWLRDPDEPGFQSLGAWIEHAASPDGGGAAISRFIPRDEVIGLGDGLFGVLESDLRRFVPLLDLIYGEDVRPRITTQGVSETRTPLTMDWLAGQTLWDPARLEELVEALRTTSPQVVLAGPPGTSKTWVARNVARFLTNDRRHAYRIVQFHPSYSYEQFIEGLRPVVEAGGIQFRRVDGVVLDLVRQMDQDELRVLVIDEMNRANLPKVLGELMYLFEYRGERIDLQYSRDFVLPPGLRFVGTMNTADRSIRSIDVALRRRFDVFECPADAGILARYYDAAVNDIADLVSGFAKLNERLEELLDRHHTIGHAFFMADPMTPERLRQVWQHKIAPLIEEYFFDQADLADEFRLADFWPSIA